MRTALAIVWTFVGLMLAGATAHADDNLGYLFTTPAQRAVLDRVPVRDSSVVGEEPEELGAATPDAGRPPIRIDGVVSSSSGKSSVWINGAASNNNAKIKTGAIRSGKVDVLVGPSGTPITLKPGQSYEPDSGAVRDAASTATPNPAAGKCRSSKAADGEIRIVCD